MANPGLFRTNWVVVAPSRRARPVTRIGIELTQTDPSTPVISPPRVRFQASNDQTWTRFANDPAIKKLATLNARTPVEKHFRRSASDSG
jgi:hypothetical protein